MVSAKFPHSPILHYTCRLLLTENNGKNNVIAVGLCTVFVVSRWRNKGLHTLNGMHNEVWDCAEILPWFILGLSKYGKPTFVSQFPDLTLKICNFV